MRIRRLEMNRSLQYIPELEWTQRPQNFMLTRSYSIGESTPDATRPTWPSLLLRVAYTLARAEALGLDSRSCSGGPHPHIPPWLVAPWRASFMGRDGLPASRVDATPAHATDPNVDIPETSREKHAKTNKLIR
jgi:hypothetical protein